MIAALYVEPDGAYYGVPGVDPWDEARDARKYAGPHPVVAHPPCQRWGRFWHGSTRKPHQFKLGDDNGCFAAALTSLERFGGVLEHPCDSHAWAAFDLSRPPRSGGWVPAGRPGMWTCCVYQGHYGHMAGKPTWLLAKAPRESLPDLRWGKGEQRLRPGRPGEARLREGPPHRDAFHDRRQGQDPHSQHDTRSVPCGADRNRPRCCGYRGEPP